MARILILTTYDKEDSVNSTIDTTISSEFDSDYETQIEAILDRAFCTGCPKCIAKFKEDIKKIGLFKYYWEPKRFVRNEAKFVHQTAKYNLTLTISIHDSEMRMSRQNFITQFSGVVTLKIHNKSCGCSSGSKTVNLFDLHCDSMDKDLKGEYIDKMRIFVEDTFGIDFAKWNEILNENYQAKIVETGYYYSR